MSNLTFKEHGHVAHQIKWNCECSNMQTHFLSLHTTSTAGIWSKVQTFFYESSPVAYQIRREWSIEHNASTYFVLTHTLDPSNGVKGQNIIFSASSLVAYQIKCNGA